MAVSGRHKRTLFAIAYTENVVHERTLARAELDDAGLRRTSLSLPLTDEPDAEELSDRNSECIHLTGSNYKRTSPKT